MCRGNLPIIFVRAGGGKEKPAEVDTDKVKKKRPKEEGLGFSIVPQGGAPLGVRIHSPWPIGEVGGEGKKKLRGSQTPPCGALRPNDRGRTAPKKHREKGAKKGRGAMLPG